MCDCCICNEEIDGFGISRLPYLGGNICCNRCYKYLVQPMIRGHYNLDIILEIIDNIKKRG
jgi:hypothetical protein